MQLFSVLIFATLIIPTYVFANDLSKDFGIGLTSKAFEAAVEEFQAQNGDQMGFALEECKLKPLLPNSDSMKIGRAIRAEVLPTNEDQIVLVGFKEGKVTTWKQLVLPNFTWWVVKFNRLCDGRQIRLSAGKEKYVYEWDGVKLKEVKSKTKNRKIKR